MNLIPGKLSQYIYSEICNVYVHNFTLTGKLKHLRIFQLLNQVTLRDLRMYTYSIWDYSRVWCDVKINTSI